MPRVLKTNKQNNTKTTTTTKTTTQEYVLEPLFTGPKEQLK